MPDWPDRPDEVMDGPTCVTCGEGICDCSDCIQRRALYARSNRCLTCAGGALLRVERWTCDCLQSQANGDTTVLARTECHYCHRTRDQVALATQVDRDLLGVDSQPPARVASHRSGLSEADQDRALRLREMGYTWNQVADAMEWARTTERGYSVARWAAYQARRRRGDYIPPRPGSTRNPRFGIEIEFNNDGSSRSGCGDEDCGCGGGEDSGLQEEVITLASEAGLNCQTEDYGHATRNYWKLVCDSTVSGGEFVSPPLDRESGMDEVRRALEAVRDAGGTAGRNQGMHVHHDASDLDNDGMVRLINVLRVWQGAIMSAVPGYRWDGSNHCGASLLCEYEWRQLIRMARNGQIRRTGRRDRGVLDSRYRSFNFDATLAYGTVEFRGLGNTLNWSKIEAWIRVTGAVVDYARRNLPIPAAVRGGLDTDQMLCVLVEHGLIDDRIAAQFRGMATDNRRGETMFQLRTVDRDMVIAADYGRLRLIPDQDETLTAS